MVVLIHSESFLSKGNGDLYLFWLIWEGFGMAVFVGFGSYVVTRAFLALFSGSDWLPHTLASHPLSKFVILLALYLVIVVEWGYTWAVVNTHRKVLARTRRDVNEDQYRAPL